MIILSMKHALFEVQTGEQVNQPLVFSRNEEMIIGKQKGISYPAARGYTYVCYNIICMG